MSSCIGITQLTIKDESRWDSLLKNGYLVNHQAVMSYVYNDVINERSHATFIFNKNGQDIAGVHYSLIASDLNLISVSDIKSGIIFRSKPDIGIYTFIIDHYLDWAKQNNVSYARVNSWFPRSVNGEIYSFSEEIEQIILKKGFNRIANPKYTYWINLTNSEEELLKNMKRQTRYDVRQGVRTGLTMEQYDKPDNVLVNEFFRLYYELGSRKKIDTISGGKFKAEVLRLLSSGVASLFVIRFNGLVVNISIASSFGRAQYLYGAMNPDFKKLKGCPSPGPVAQWEMIKAMKRKGLRLYDMGFCPGPVPNPEHPKYPIWRFKFGFGGVPVEFLPLYGIVIKPLRGRLFYFLNKQR